MKQKRQFTKEFKLEAINLVREQGLSASNAAKDLGNSYYTLKNWLILAAKDKEEAFPGKGKLKPSDERVRKLERENRILRMERDILKKTIGYFAETPK